MNEVRFPRRKRLDLHIPAETAIHQAIQAVENLDAHPLLTEAVISLSLAADKVADYVDDYVKRYDDGL